tara:strand:+ start:44048 stop:44203 length:156 start_codon:yes stop_codon:yes gene_type:complete
MSDITELKFIAVVVAALTCSHILEWIFQILNVEDNDFGDCKTDAQRYGGGR